MTEKLRKEHHDDGPDETVKVKTNQTSTKRSEESLDSQGTDERGQYAKTHAEPEKTDDYRSKSSGAKKST